MKMNKTVKNSSMKVAVYNEAMPSSEDNERRQAEVNLTAPPRELALPALGTGKAKDALPCPPPQSLL